MHVVVDARALSPQRDGISTYIREVVPRVIDRLPNHRFTLLTTAVIDDLTADWKAERVYVESRAMWPTQNVTVPLALRRLRPDVYFYPAHDPPVVGIRCPIVLAIHDLTPLELRPYFESGDRLKRAYLRIVVRRAVSRAHAILVPSDATRSVLDRLFGEDRAAKVTVCWYGAALASSPRGEPRHLLYLGTDRPHKNLLRLIDAYGEAARERPELPPLVLAGGFRRPDRVREHIMRSGVDERIVVTGHVDDEQAERLLLDATALLMPSMAEGFGFPIADAMANGVPVLTSDRSACGEIADGAALMVSPTDTKVIARGIVDISCDAGLRESLVGRGFERASSFDWERTADATAAVIAASG